MGIKVYPMVYLNPNFRHLSTHDLKVMSAKCDNHADHLRTKLAWYECELNDLKIELKNREGL